METIVKLRKLKELPKDGYFMLLWEYNGIPWSNTFKAEAGSYSMYNDENDQFEFCHDPYCGVEVFEKYILELVE